jgi:hypothetical protein
MPAAFPPADERPGSRTFSLCQKHAPKGGGRAVGLDIENARPRPHGRTLGSSTESEYSRWVREYPETCDCRAGSRRRPAAAPVLGGPATARRSRSTRSRGSAAGRRPFVTGVHCCHHPAGKYPNHGQTPSTRSTRDSHRKEPPRGGPPAAQSRRARTATSTRDVGLTADPPGAPAPVRWARIGQLVIAARSAS